jgi:methionyl-tRNA formyltransferase
MPGAYALLQAEPVKIWRARVRDAQGEAGSVLDAQDEVVIACGEKALAVSELQRAGGRRLSAREFLRGHPLPTGVRFA